jgi:hypothetical protein
MKPDRASIKWADKFHEPLNSMHLGLDHMLMKERLGFFCQ